MSPPVDLAGTGPGEELVAHLAAVLASLDASLSPSLQTGAAGPSEAAETGEQAQLDLLDLLDAQMTSRWLDVAARRMHAIGQGFSAIGSSGHEANAAVALATRVGDPALLHYRSGGFYLAEPDGPATTTASSTSLWGWPAASTSRSPGAGTRCSATPISR